MSLLWVGSVIIYSSIDGLIFIRAMATATVTATVTETETADASAVASAVARDDLTFIRATATAPSLD